VSPPRPPSLPYRWGDAPTEAHLWALECKRRASRFKLLTEYPDPEKRVEIVAAEVEMCRRDPCYWIDQWAWVFNPKSEPGHSFMQDVPFVLWPEQRALVHHLQARYEAGETSLATKGRELGVTWIHLYFCLHHFTLGQGWRARLFSAKEDKVDDGTGDSLFGMLRYALSNLPGFLNPCRAGESSALWLGCKATGSEIIGESANSGLARGQRAAWMLGDEFAHLDPPAKAWPLWTSTARVARSRALISTHKGPGTKFAELEAMLPERCVFRMTWRADPRRPANFREIEMADGMTAEEFEQEHEARAVVLTTGKMFKGPLVQAGSDARDDIRKIEYHDEHPDWQKVVQDIDIRHRGFLAGGWDFGSGPSLLVCLRALVEPGPAWRLWVDFEHPWDQVSWQRAAADVKRHDEEEYGWQQRWHWGDPAGINRESDQMSWETNLISGGIPLTCLAAEYNQRDGQEWMVKQVQLLIDTGRLRVHRRCKYLWKCLESWTRDIPHGADAALINRLYIPPRHDVYSHGGMALCYLIAGVLIGMSAAHERSDQALGQLPPAPGGEIASMLYSVADQREAADREGNATRRSAADRTQGASDAARTG
jgi:hypothetical protein